MKNLSSQNSKSCDSKSMGDFRFLIFNFFFMILGILCTVYCLLPLIYSIISKEKNIS